MCVCLVSRRGLVGLLGFQGLGGGQGPQDAVAVEPGVVGLGQEHDLGGLVRHGGLAGGGLYVGGIDVFKIDAASCPSGRVSVGSLVPKDRVKVPPSEAVEVSKFCMAFCKAALLSPV